MTDAISLTLGRRLRHRRRLLKLTQVQVAAMVGIRFQQIQKYECAANQVSVPRLIQLCEALETTPSTILEGIMTHGNAQT